MKGRRGNQGRMERLVQRWQRGGDPLTAFARKQGVSRGQLEYWRRRMGVPSRRARAAATARQAITFAPVHVMGTREAAALELVLADGVRVRIDAAAPTELAVAIVAALRRAC
jgi:transposase-like protein